MGSRAGSRTGTHSDSSVATGHLYCAVLKRQMSAYCRTAETQESQWCPLLAGGWYCRGGGAASPEIFIFFTVLLVLLVTWTLTLIGSPW